MSVMRLSAVVCLLVLQLCLLLLDGFSIVNRIRTNSINSSPSQSCIVPVIRSVTTQLNVKYPSGVREEWQTYSLADDEEQNRRIEQFDASEYSSSRGC